MFRVRVFVLNAAVHGGALSKQSEAGRLNVARSRVFCETVWQFCYSAACVQF